MRTRGSPTCLSASSSHPQLTFSLSSACGVIHAIHAICCTRDSEYSTPMHVDRVRTSLDPLVLTQRLQHLRHTLPSTRASNEEDQTPSHRARLGRHKMDDNRPEHIIDASTIYPAVRAGTQSVTWCGLRKRWFCLHVQDSPISERYAAVHPASCSSTAEGPPSRTL